MMESIEHFLTSPLIESIGWTVIHSCWQATVLVFVYHMCASLYRFKTVRQKYNFAYSVLLSQLLLSIITFCLLFSPSKLQEIVVGNAEVQDVFGGITSGVYQQGIWDQIQSILLPFMPLVVCVWGLGMLFFFVRLLMGYFFSYRLRTRGLAHVPGMWKELFDRLKIRMSIRSHVDIGLSLNVDSPMLIGHFKPIILLPLALVNQLTIEQVELIMVHELAHLRRLDFALNFIQLIIETIFYYHPAIWWLSQEIRTAREECTDDLTLKYTNKSMIYAQTLLTVAEQSKRYHPLLGMSLLGQNKKHLLTRIQRILQQPVKQPDMREKFAVTSLLLFLAVAISLGAAWSSPTDNWPGEKNDHWVIDTLPMGQIRMEVDDDGETLSVSLKDGEIEKLNVNGKEIPPSEFSNYEERVAEMFENMPPPPPPPPPAPSAPRAPNAPEAVVPPPPPPAPTHRTYTVERSVKKVIEDGEVVEIIIEDGDTREIIIEEDVYEDMDIRESLTEEEMEQIEKRREEIKIREVERAERRLEMAERELQRAEREVERAERLAEREAEMVERRVEMEERMEERIEREEERIERLIEEHEKTKDQWLEEELLKDNLISSKNNYNVKLNNKRMKVNGSTVSGELHAKYMRLYEEQVGTSFTDKTSVNISKEMY